MSFNVEPAKNFRVAFVHNYNNNKEDGWVVETNKK